MSNIRRLCAVILCFVIAFCSMNTVLSNFVYAETVNDEESDNAEIMGIGSAADYLFASASKQYEADGYKHFKIDQTDEVWKVQSAEVGTDNWEDTTQCFMGSPDSKYLNLWYYAGISPANEARYPAVHVRYGNSNLNNPKQLQVSFNYGYNVKHNLRIIYTAEADGFYSLSDSLGGISGLSSYNMTNADVYALVSVNGAEKWKSEPFNAENYTAQDYSGIKSYLKKGDILSISFELSIHDGYTIDDVSGGNGSNVYFYLSPELSYTPATDEVVGTGSVADYLETKVREQYAATGAQRFDIDQSNAAWRVQSTLAGTTDWTDTTKIFIGSPNDKYLNIWYYAGTATTNQARYPAVHVRYQDSNLSKPKQIQFSFNYGWSVKHNLRLVYTAGCDGIYTLSDGLGGISGKDTYDLTNADVYAIIAVNGVEQWRSEPFNAENYAKQNYGGEWELKMGDQLTVTFEVAIHDGYTLEDVLQGGDDTVFYLRPELSYKKYVARIDSKYYFSLEDAISAAKNGDEIALCSDITVSEPIDINKDITVNLANRTIYSTVKADSIFRATADFTLKGGKISGDGTSYGIATAKSECNIAVYDTVINFDTDNGALFTASADGAGLALKNVTADTNCLLVNCAQKDEGEQYAFASVDVTEGIYTTENTGFAVTLNGKAVFDGVTVNVANGNAVEIAKSGDNAVACFEKCSFTVTESSGEYNNAALVVSQGTVAVINSGTYTGADYSVYAQGGKLTVIGGVFKGSLYEGADNAEILISGGTFDTDITDMVYHNSSVTEENGLYTVTDNSVGFWGENHYKMKNTLDAMPATVEATVYLSPTVDDMGGPILSNYTNSSAGTFKLDIGTNGRPRIYLSDASARVISHTFNTDIRTGGWAHIALVFDVESDSILLYLDGQLKETKAASGLELFALNAPLRVGSNNDYDTYDRWYQSGVFFEGKLASLTMYSDIRTAEEIALDMKSVLPTGDNIEADYRFSRGYYTSIEDNSANLNKLLNCGVISEAEPLDEYSYSFAVLGDTQILTEYYPEQFPIIYDWIIQNKEKHNIKYIVGLGDITNSTTDREWDVAMESFNKLDASGIPYSLIRGNHDTASVYDKYLNTDSVFAKQVDGYYGSNLQNTYKVFTVGEVDYMLITLDYKPTADEISWADSLIASHPNHNVIITTHWYLNDNLTTSNGIWENLASKHQNVVLVLSGHVSEPDIKVLQSKGVSGNTVTQMLINPQGIDEDHRVMSKGLVAMFYFSQDGKNLQVRYYSTVTEKYFGEQNQFDITLDAVEYRYGDVNDDANVNVLDLVRIKKVIAKQDVKFNSRTADINKDSDIDGFDLTELRKKLIDMMQ